MAIDHRRFASQLWTGITDPTARRALQDLSEKLEALARAANDNTPADTFPVGAVVMWFGGRDAIPAGWVEYEAAKGRFFRHMLDGGTAGDLGGSDTHTHSMNHSHTGAANNGGTHIHTITSEANHNHSITSEGHSHSSVNISYGTFNAAPGGTTVMTPLTGASVPTSGSHAHGGATGTAGGHSHGGLTGGGSPEGLHSHSLTVDPLTANTGSGSTLPKYIDGILIQKA